MNKGQRIQKGSEHCFTKENKMFSFSFPEVLGLCHVFAFTKVV